MTLLQQSSSVYHSLASAPHVLAQTAAAPALAPGPSRGPLRLRFIVMDAVNCTPVPGARIEVWHARADGYYCGYPGQGDSHNVNTTGDTFMRGTRIEDALGEASSAPSTPAGTKSVP